MNQHPQRERRPRRFTPPAMPASSEDLMDVMSALLGIIERETELVRAGKVAAAMALEPNKTDLSRRYVSAVEHLKASQPYLSQTAPELLTLHRHHDVFAPCCRSTLRCSRRRMRCPKASCAASMPRSSAAIFPTPIPRRDGARRRARAT